MTAYVYALMGFRLLVGLGALTGGLVMWRRSGRVGWAFVAILLGLASIWLGTFPYVVGRALSEFSTGPRCGPAGCMTMAWTQWHRMQLRNLVITLPRLIALAYGVILLAPGLRRRRAS